jgi:hypothetical protein
VGLLGEFCRKKKEAFFFEKKAEARPAGTKKLLCFLVGDEDKSATANKSFLLLFFKKEDFLLSLRYEISARSSRSFIRFLRAAICFQYPNRRGWRPGEKVDRPAWPWRQITAAVRASPFQRAGGTF